MFSADGPLPLSTVGPFFIYEDNMATTELLFEYKSVSIFINPALGIEEQILEEINTQYRQGWLPSYSELKGKFHLMWFKRLKVCYNCGGDSPRI